MIKFLMKSGILLCFLLNLVIGFKFYNVAIPLQVKNTEQIYIQRTAKVFHISLDVAKTFFVHGELKGVDPVLLASIAVPESNQNPNAVSSKGYTGRLQSSLVKLPDEVEMLNGTVKLVNFTKVAKGDINLALRMYNGGTNPNVYNSGECRNYANNVLRIYKRASAFVYNI